MDAYYVMLWTRYTVAWTYVKTVWLSERIKEDNGIYTQYNLHELKYWWRKECYIFQKHTYVFKDLSHSQYQGNE